MSKIGVIIIVYNGRPYLDELFVSLSAVKYPNWEIIFIDNASSDDSAAYAREKFLPQFSNLKIIMSEKNLGFAGGNNVGLEYLAENNFDFAYLLNQDTTVSPDFLEKALAVAAEGVASVQSLILLHPSVIPAPPSVIPAASPAKLQRSGEAGIQINTLGNAIHYLGFGYCYGYGWDSEKTKQFLQDWKRRDPEFQIAYASGAGTLFKMAALREVGFFDEDYFMYHEDLDLGWRLRLAGYKNVLSPESVIYHKYEFGKSIKKYYWMERNRYLVIFKNYSAWTLILILPALIIMEAGMFFFSIRSGWWRMKLKVYEYFLYPKNWRKILVRRRDVQKKRKVSDRRIAPHFVGEILFQDIDNWVLRKIANPAFKFYWKIIKAIL